MLCDAEDLLAQFRLGCISSIVPREIDGDKLGVRWYFEVTYSSGDKYFLKVQSREQLRRWRREVAATHVAGRWVNGIPEPLTTRHGSAASVSKKFVGLLFPFIDGVSLPGIVLHDDLLANFMATLCRIHQVPVRGCSSPFLEIRRARFFKRLSRLQTALSHCHSASAALHRELLAYMHSAVEEQVRRMPSHEVPHHLLHGDYLPQNTILAPDRRLWVVDWERAAKGPPIVDVFRSAVFLISGRKLQPKMLRVDLLLKYMSFYFARCTVKEFALSGAVDWYLIALALDIRRFESLYIARVPVQLSKIVEDFELLRWIQEHRLELDEGLSATLKSS